ncbi:MAG: class I SAM-dependent methyltransferase [Candidatus Aenigmarchaeota archaeon]|nr:class I SAM-dependent methyltransferase [Candidatus Aenigmarchaeota archaeon]
MVMDVFNRLAKRYDTWYDSEKGRPLYESELLCLRPLVAELNAPFLEIGVGTGRFATRFPGVVGLDPAFGALRMASMRGVPPVLGVGEKLPFNDGSFGGVLIILTLCFVKNPVEALKESWRVLTQGGGLILGTIPKDSDWGAFYWRKNKENNPFFEKLKLYTMKETERMIKNTGFRIEKIRSTLLQPPQDKSFVEEPCNTYMKKAGFICLLSKKI